MHSHPKTKPLRIRPFYRVNPLFYKELAFLVFFCALRIFTVVPGAAPLCVQPVVPTETERTK